jgi:hypothetical protein
MNAQLPRQNKLYKTWYKGKGFNAHSSLLYDFIMANDLNVVDFNFKQPVKYTYFNIKNNTFTWIDHILCTDYDKLSVSSCQIIPLKAENVSDHLPLTVKLFINVNGRTQGDHNRTQTNVCMPYYPIPDWNHSDRNENYRNILASKLN